MITSAAIYMGLHGTFLNALLAIQYKELTVREYLSNYAFYGLVYIPSSYGSIKLLNSMRTRLFPEFTPHQMQYFSLMYFASKPAMVFDLVFVHLIYQGFLAVGLFSYCQHFYSQQPIRKDDDKEQLNKSLWKMIKFRVQLSLASVLIDLWIPQVELYYLNLKEDPKIISQRVRSFYGAKHGVFTIGWHYLIVSTYLQYASLNH